MKKPLDVFCEIPCLTEGATKLDGLALQKKWFKSADKRFIGQYLQKFIDYNSAQFKFLGVQPYIIGSDKRTSLTFCSSHFIGSIPLRSSDTGKQIGDFVVTPRFTGRDRFEAYIEILNLLGSEIGLEVLDSLPLVSGRNFRPPLYLEAVKFVKALEKLTARPWRKFDNIEIVSNQPMGQTNWRKYVNNEFKVEKRLNFPVKANILSEVHSDYAKIRYVFDICKGELLSANTPQKIKLNLYDKLSFLEERLYWHKPKVAREIKIRFSDNPDVVSCKEQANKILHFDPIECTAWRVDFADVFEKFMQYIFKEAAKETGSRLYSNFKFRSKSLRRYSWELAHIEPDAILQKDNIMIFVDAKYKANLYAKFKQSKVLKDEYRRDLHQIMAYTSYSNTDCKFGFLCYPSEEVELKTTSYENSMNQSVNTIFIMGIPLRKNCVVPAKTLLIEQITKISNMVDCV